MSAWAARYVRLKDRGQDVTRLRGRIDSGATLVDDGASTFATWLVPTPLFQPDDLSALSRDFGEALAIAVQTVADLIIYDHFVAGSRVRGLTYAGEAGWVRVVGSAEPWEAPELFSKAKFEELVAELEGDLDDDTLAGDKAQLLSLWRDSKLVEGRALPPADPAAMTRAIEKHFGLPPHPKA
jgi:hypothetical protein